MSDEAKSIYQKRQEWISAVNAGDVEKYLSILSENIIWFPPVGQVISGKAEFREWVEPFFEKFNYDFYLSQIKTKINGSWSIERGIFTSKMIPLTGGNPMEHSGNYLIFWHRSKEGEWAIERYVDDTNG